MGLFFSLFRMGSALQKKRTFKKFYFRGVDLDALMEISTEEFGNLVTARARRRLIKRGLTRILCFKQKNYERLNVNLFKEKSQQLLKLILEMILLFLKW